ncbi:mitochondrial ribosomal protein S16 [Drechslerella stenobrocha 248]|uniref:Mitochondrial ribosomal protein S16 n=1 Tax=Drechslerella stenobrocha 248 TaxID=1043628 RepID=W7IFZ9_9PEZI|nr:mitochondrial ribosomal protein S16 [Drechslerella stenobrocha 248]
MVVRLRLARFGKRNSPVYNIVVMQARTARDSKPMEIIGTYDPIPKIPSPSEIAADGGDDRARKPIKDIRLDVARAKYWLGVGAQPSDPVWRLFAMFGLIEPQWKVVRIPAQQEDKALYEKVQKVKIIQDKAGARATGSS